MPSYPAFYDQAPKIVLFDPLSAFLGATEGGLIEYGYIDAVRLTGHSCPTVAGAYLMAVKAVKALFGEETPVRGGIEVAFRDPLAAGVTGVTGAVAGLLTGAAGEGGFKGIAGRFSRRDRLTFDETVTAEVRFRRSDTGRAIEVSYDGRVVPSSPETTALLQAMLANVATPAERERFHALWQDRVRRILIEHADDPTMIVLSEAA